jgi:hypothetical protein
MSKFCNERRKKWKEMWLIFVFKTEILFRVRTSKLDILSLRSYANPNLTKFNDARFEVLTSALLTNQVFWHVTPCRWVSSSRRFEGIYFLPFQGSSRPVTFSLPFERATFFRNVGHHSPNNTNLTPSYQMQSQHARIFSLKMVEDVENKILKF